MVGYGRIIPQWMLDLPPLGNINLHASLLPKYRGAAPDPVGDCARRNRHRGHHHENRRRPRYRRHSAAAGNAHRSNDTAETLAPKLAAIGADLMVKTLHGLQAGSIHPRPQDQTLATLAPILKKEDGLIDFSRPATEILNRMRGFQPWPGACTKFRGKNLQVWKASALDRKLKSSELKVEDDRLFVGCGQGSAIELLELQLEGKKRTSAADFIRGYRPAPGEKLGS